MEKVKVNLYISVVVNLMYALFIAQSIETKIAVNFQLNGLPNSYQTPNEFMITQIILTFSMAFLFLLLPWIIRKMPVKWVNIPNSKKWLTGEERDKSLKKIDFMLILLGVVMLYFFTAMNVVVYAANISTPMELPILPFICVVLIFLGFLTTWTIKLYKMFS
ncbi:MAG: hypothetical protein PF692_09150 [Kiritimatiellae bacterium]|jgi:hypothetical protein|nr:hypothetical protein [Kiritimatiellia bacterium]